MSTYVCMNHIHQPSTHPIFYLCFRYRNPLTPELNPSAQRCLTRYFSEDFVSWTVRFFNICVKDQQMKQLFIQFINYVR
jgi:hypothetical protein